MADSKLFQAISKAAKLGKFGDNYKLVSLVPSNVHGEDHFGSDVVFAEANLQIGFNEKSVYIVVKNKQEDASYRKMINADIHFYNEVLMYNEILPALDKNGIMIDVFPKRIYGRATLGDNYAEDIVVMEDLRHTDFSLTKEKLFLDFGHCKLVLKKLARFHALSYAKKQENSKEFYKLVDTLREVNNLDTRKDEINKFLRISIFRGVLNLEKETDEFKIHLDQMKKNIEDPFNLMKTLCQPEEPMAVICHGDFCRNNMLFRYEDDGKPVDVRFFDIAIARYASPAIDLSFFLLMNTTTELRRDHWDDFFEAYHEALTSIITPDCSVPSLEDIKQEFKVKALYGYTLCSFFIPKMMEEERSDSENCASIRGSRGGESEKIIKDIVRDLIRFNCV